jgi:hypothetical protein
MAMLDQAPEGYLPLKIAFERFHGRPHEPLDDDELIKRFVDYLARGRINVIIREPSTGERLALPQEAWKEAQFAWRPLFFSTILGNENANDMFKPYKGRTPFVSTAQLSAIMELSGSADPEPPHRGLYPWDRCRKAFLSKVAKDGAPTVDCDEKGWRRPADVGRWVAAWMLKRLGDKVGQPGESTIRRHVRGWLAEVKRSSRS